jgi:hypothetical protein
LKKGRKTHIGNWNWMNDSSNRACKKIKQKGEIIKWKKAKS